MSKSSSYSIPSYTLQHLFYFHNDILLGRIVEKKTIPTKERDFGMRITDLYNLLRVAHIIMEIIQEVSFPSKMSSIHTCKPIHNEQWDTMILPKEYKSQQESRCQDQSKLCTKTVLWMNRFSFKLIKPLERNWMIPETDIIHSSFSSNQYNF